MFKYRDNYQGKVMYTEKTDDTHPPVVYKYRENFNHAAIKGGFTEKIMEQQNHRNYPPFDSTSYGTGDKSPFRHGNIARRDRYTKVRKNTLRNRVKDSLIERTSEN